MTNVTLILTESYSHWYEKAVDYVFDFFEDPLYSQVGQKDFLSKLLLDPQTLLNLLVYVVYQGKILIETLSKNHFIRQYTSVLSQAYSRYTNVSKPTQTSATFVNSPKAVVDLDAHLHLSPAIGPKLHIFLTASVCSIISGWTFLCIFRPIKPIILHYYLKQWKNTITPFLLSGFRYYLIGPKSPVNMPFSVSSFC
jgi:hypothetical protein